jgi:hypothetical protein
MDVIPIWAIYSYWSFALTVLWLLGVLPFSPLASAVATFIGSIIFVFFKNKIFRPVGILIMVSHLVPVLILRKTKFNFFENFLIFIVYNLALLATGTNFKKIYTKIFQNPPMTVNDYLCQRGLI